VLGWITSFSGCDPAFLRRSDELLKNIHRVYSTRGVLPTIAYCKAIRGNLLNYLSGNPERLPGVRLRPSGVPKALGALAADVESGKLSTLE